MVAAQGKLYTAYIWCFVKIKILLSSTAKFIGLFCLLTIAYIIYLQVSYVLGGLLIEITPSAAWLSVSSFIILLVVLFCPLGRSLIRIFLIKSRKLDKEVERPTTKTCLYPASKRALINSCVYFVLLLSILLWDEWQKWNGFVTNAPIKGFILSITSFMCLVASAKFCLKKSFVPSAIYMLAVLFSFSFFRGIESIEMPAKAYVFSIFPELCPAKDFVDNKTYICYRYINDAGLAHKTLIYSLEDEPSLSSSQYRQSINNIFSATGATEKLSADDCPTFKAKRMFGHIYLVSSDCLPSK